jgi:hypothetical protein
LESSAHAASESAASERTAYLGIASRIAEAAPTSAPRR